MSTMRIIIISVALQSTTGCTASLDSHSDVVDDSSSRPRDSDTADWDDDDPVVDLTECGNLANDGIDEFVSPFLEAHTAVYPDGTLSRDPHVMPAEGHPGWGLRSRWLLSLDGTDKSSASFATSAGPARLDVNADVRDRPEPRSSLRQGTFTQLTDSEFKFEDAQGAVHCRRAPGPTHPDRPVAQTLWSCTDDVTGLRLEFFVRAQLSYVLPEKCLADHEPLPNPTRWGRIRSERRDGSIQNDYGGPPRSTTGGVEKYDHSELLVENFAGRGEWVSTTVVKDLNTGGSFVVERTSQTVHIVYQADRLLVVDASSDEQLQLMSCEFEPDGDRPAGHDALNCTDFEGKKSDWRATDMAFPFGWGSHDSPGGWWFEP